MAKAISFEKSAFRLKLKDLGLTDSQLEETMTQFDRRNRHVDIITISLLFERFGLTRAKVYAFLKGIGVDDPSLITAFSRADLRKAGLDEDKVQEVVFTD